MKGKRIALSCAVMLLTAAGGVMAGDIYKWTDDNGTVHYVDRPTGAKSEQRLNITYSRTNNSAVQARAQARTDSQPATSEESDPAANAQEAAYNATLAEERKQKCEQSRVRLETYLQARRLYRTDENGERVYLDEGQSQEARKKAEEQVAEFCS